MTTFHSLRISILVAVLTTSGLLRPYQCVAQSKSENVGGYADTILGRPTANPNVVDRNSDSLIDVRDLVIFINGLPVEASFGTTESRVFPSQESIDIPIIFTKPATGKLRIELSGSAVRGTDYGDFGAPVTDFENIIREIELTNATSTMLTVPLLSNSKKFRGERRMVLSLHSLATINGTQVDRSAGPSPGSIPTHTIIISEGENMWSGIINFDRRSGFGSFPVSFALDSGGALRFAIRGSRFFASSQPAKGQLSPAGDLELTVPLAGTFQMADGGLPAAWSLHLTRLAATNNPGFLPVAQYSAQLQIDDFPVRGLVRMYNADLTLAPSR